MQHRIPKHFITAFYLLFTIFTRAQTSLHFQTSEGFRIKHAEITVYNPFGVLVTVTKDSTNGSFLVHEDFNRIIVVAKGFSKLDSMFNPMVKNGSKLVIALKPETQILEEVIVTTNKTGSKLKESPVSITLVKPYLVQNKITADISQVLEQVPGVTIADNQINIRNGTGWSYGAGSRVAVLVDDLPMLSADAASPQFAFMPVENLASIEVVKSAGSVLYGSSALNGVINLRTADATDKPSASVSMFTGFYGNPPRDSLKWGNRVHTASGLNGFYSQKFGRTGLTVSWNILANEGYRQKEMDYRGRFTIKLKHDSKIKGLSYGLNTSVQRGFSGTFLLWKSYAQGYTPLDSGYNYTYTNRISIDPSVTFKRNGTTHKYLSRIYLLDNIVDNGNPKNNQSNGSSLWYNEYKISHPFFKNHLLLSGGAVAMLSETHSPLFSGHQKSRNLASYIQGEYRLGRLIATAGARYEYFKLNDFQQSRPVFRTGLNYALAKYTNLRASWGQGYRFPSMAEAFTATTVGSLTIFPNPGLKPESGSSEEVGIKQGYRIGGFKGYLDVAAYRMRIDNMMEFTFAQWGNIFGPLLGLGFKSINVAKCQISGYEIETAGEGKIRNVTFNVLGGYTYSNPITLQPDKVFAIDSANRKLNYSDTRADTNNYLKYRYKNLIRLDVQARWKKLEVGVSMRYNSAMLNIDKAFVEDPFDLVVPEINRSRRKLSTATVFDVRAGFYFSTHFKLNFQVMNLLNREYIGRPCDLRPPRSFQLQAVWKL